MQDQIKHVIHFGYQNLYTCWTFEEDWGIFVCPMDGNVSIEGCCPRGELIWAIVLYNRIVPSNVMGTFHGWQLTLPSNKSLYYLTAGNLSDLGIWSLLIYLNTVMAMYYHWTYLRTGLPAKLQQYKQQQFLSKLTWGLIVKVFLVTGMVDICYRSHWIFEAMKYFS